MAGCGLQSPWFAATISRVRSRSAQNHGASLRFRSRQSDRESPLPWQLRCQPRSPSACKLPPDKPSDCLVDAKRHATPTEGIDVDIGRPGHLLEEAGVTFKDGR